MRDLLTNVLKASFPVLLPLLSTFVALSQPKEDQRIKIVDEEAQHFATKAAYLSHKNSYLDRAASMHIVPLIANNWYGSKINLTKERKFKRMGVDLKEMSSRTNHITDYKFHTLFSDVIINGVVIDKVYEKSRASYWHTMYTIQVTEVLKGSSLDSVKIYQMSGYIEDKPMRLFLDQLLFEGDKGIFYLKYWTSSDIEFVQRELSSGYGANGATEVNITDDGRSFGMPLFQPIKDGYIYHEGNREGKSDKILSKVRKIVKTNDADAFYDTNF